MMDIFRYAEIAVYTLIYFLPYTLLAFYPFKNDMRFPRWVNALIIAAAAALQFCIHLEMAVSDAHWIVALGKTFVLAAVFVLITKVHFGKSLFTVLMLSNIQNFAICAGKCFEGLLFPELARQHFRWSNILMVIVAEALILIPLFFYMRKFYVRAVHEPRAMMVWRYIWLVPLTFFSVWFRNFYFSAEGSLTLALRPRHLLYTLVVNSGALLIYAMVMRLIEEQAENDKLREKETQHLLQQKQFEVLSERIEEARTAKHDMRQHLHIISACLSDRKYEELEAYINRYTQSLPEMSAFVYCEHYAVNALLQYFAGQAKAHGIGFSARAAIPAGIGIPEEMLTVLFGNLLENALEACMHEQKAIISIRAEISEGALFVKIKNTFTGKVKKRSDGLYLSTKHEGRGIGLRSVRGIVSEHKGLLKIKQGDGLFTVSALLNIPE